MAQGDSGDPKREEIADALSRLSQEGAPSEIEPAAPLTPAAPLAPAQPPSPPASAAEFRRPTRPAAPGAGARPPAPPRPSSTTPPASTPHARPARPDRLDRPDRPAGPPAVASDDTAADAAAGADEMTIVVDDDAVMVPAPEPQLLAHAGARKRASGMSSLAFRRTAIPILLTCGLLLICIGLLRWIGGSESLFSDMSIPLSAALCGSGVLMLLVAALNMLAVKAELASAATRSNRQRG